MYEPADIFYEERQSFSNPNDRFAGWAACELPAESYKIEYDWNAINIVRPEMYMDHMIILTQKMLWLSRV